MEKLCKQLTDTNRNNYGEILSFESKKDDFEKTLSERDTKIKLLEEEKATTLQDGKMSVDLLKDVKEAHARIEIVYRNETKKA